ncbi:hypothetical protein ACOJQI_11390 [Bacillus salacetis]|uniref:hypothetical protein n=1 Tax=Bacillus salacetis TaxID=2315464 RepID=UPI003BA12A62
MINHLWEYPNKDVPFKHSKDETIFKRESSLLKGTFLEGCGILQALFLIILGIWNLGVFNFIAFKVSSNNRKKMIWSGCGFILLSPVIFYVAAVTVSYFVKHENSAGIISMIYASLYLLNGIILILIGLLSHKFHKVG